MRCPRCGLENPDTAMWCDCGYDFRSGQMRRHPALGAPGTAIAQFVSAASRARWTVRLLIAGICLDVVAMASGLLQVSLVNRVIGGAAITAAEAAANDSRQGLIGGLRILLFLATAVAFLMWLSRAYKNLWALNAVTPSYSPGWAVGSFFVPFLNLVRPFRIVRELWHLSDSGSTIPALRAEGRNLPTPAVVGWWWGIWLVSGFLGQAALRASWQMKTPQDILGASYVSLVGDVVSIVAAFLAISLVRAIEAKQTCSHRGLGPGNQVTATSA